MFCPNCGNEIKPGANFCNCCGQPVVVKKAEDIKPEENEVKKQPAEPSVKTKSKTKTKGLIITMIVLLAILAGLVVTFFAIDNDFSFIADNTSTSSEDEAAELSIEDMLIANCWTSNYEGYRNVLFRPLENNINFDGIAISGDWINVHPYKITEDGGVTVYYEDGYDDSPESCYEPIWKIKSIETNENQTKQFVVSEYGVDIQFEEVVINDIEVSLIFNQWADFDYNINSVSDAYISEDIMVEEAQRNVVIYDFWKVGIYSSDYNMLVSIESEIPEEGESFDEKYTFDLDNKCIFIGDDRYEINDDYSQLYCEETDHTIYRITDFAFGKIADTDFPPGEFIE